jgi:hypothetical protein
VRLSVNRGEYFGSDANARWQNARHRRDHKSIWMDREEVCIKGVMVCVEQSGNPLRQSSEPLCAFPHMCAAVIKLG